MHLHNILPLTRSSTESLKSFEHHLNDNHCKKFVIIYFSFNACRLLEGGIIVAMIITIIIIIIVVIVIVVARDRRLHSIFATV